MCMKKSFGVPSSLAPIGGDIEVQITQRASPLPLILFEFVLSGIMCALLITPCCTKPLFIKE